MTSHSTAELIKEVESLSPAEATAALQALRAQLSPEVREFRAIIAEVTTYPERAAALLRKVRGGRHPAKSFLISYLESVLRCS